MNDQKRLTSQCGTCGQWFDGDDTEQVEYHVHSGPHEPQDLTKLPSSEKADIFPDLGPRRNPDELAKEVRIPITEGMRLELDRPGHSIPDEREWNQLSVEERLHRFLAENRTLVISDGDSEIPGTIEQTEDEESDWQAGYQEALTDIMEYVINGIPLPPMEDEETEETA